MEKTFIDKKQALVFLTSGIATGYGDTRLYGVMTGKYNGQINSIKSVANLNDYEYSQIWISNMTTKDLINVCRVK